jgi:hypothetical protein
MKVEELTTKDYFEPNVIASPNYVGDRGRRIEAGPAEV